MLLEEFDMEEYIRMERRDSYADGLEDGLSKGEAIGLSKGEAIGLSKGEAIGLSKGRQSERLHLIFTLLKNGISTEQCASLIGEDPRIIAKIYQLSKNHPDWSEDEILQAVSLK